LHGFLEAGRGLGVKQGMICERRLRSCHRWRQRVLAACGQGCKEKEKQDSRVAYQS